MHPSNRRRVTSRFLYRFSQQVPAGCGDVREPVTASCRGVPVARSDTPRRPSCRPRAAHATRWAVTCGFAIWAFLTASVGWAAPIGTAFTYQATLADPGGAINGVRDLRVTLFDSSIHGSVVAGPLTIADVAVTDGRVVVELDFGDVFDDAGRWLSIEVRDGAGDFRILGPRRRIWATPYAAHAVEADAAQVAGTVPTAGNADTLDGQPGTAYLEWANLTAVPAELDDGDDDTLEAIVCSSVGEGPVWNGAGWACGPDIESGYLGITFVGPVGDALTNGAALLAAMAAIPTPTGRDEAWLLRVEPGLYDLGGATLEMKPWVDVEGGGQNITVVRSEICGLLGLNPIGAVTGASVAELRNLSVENTCAVAERIGVAISVPDTATAASIHRVTARSTSVAPTGWAAAIYVDGARTTIEDVKANSSGATYWNAGIVVRADSALILDTIGVGDGGDMSYGLVLVGDVFVPEPHMTVNRCSFLGTNSLDGYGVFVISASADLEHLSSGGSLAVVVANSNGNNTVNASHLAATGGVEATISGGSLAVTISQSRVWSYTAPTVLAEPTVVMRVAATQLWGDPVSGTVTCAGVWDENWNFYTNTCP